MGDLCDRVFKTPVRLMKHVLVCDASTEQIEELSNTTENHECSGSFTNFQCITSNVQAVVGVGSAREASQPLDMVP